MCTYLIHTCVYDTYLIHTCVGTCAGRDQSGKSSFDAIYIVALRQQSLTDLEFLIWVRLTGQQTPRNYPSLFHIARDTGTPRHTQVFSEHVCCGFELSSSCLQSRYSYSLSHPPSQLFFNQNNDLRGLKHWNTWCFTLALVFTQSVCVQMVTALPSPQRRSLTCPMCLHWGSYSRLRSEVAVRTNVCGPNQVQHIFILTFI